MTFSMKKKFVSGFVALGIALSIIGCTKEDSAVPENVDQLREVTLDSDVIQEVKVLESAEAYFSASRVPSYTPENGTLLGTGPFALRGDVIGAVAWVDSRSAEERLEQREDAFGNWVSGAEFQNFILLYMDQAGSVVREIPLKEMVSEEIYAVRGLYPRLDGGFHVVTDVVYDEQNPYGELRFFQMDADGELVGEVVALKDDPERDIVSSSFGRGIVDANGLIYVSGYERTEESESDFVVVFDSAGEEIFRVNGAAIGTNGSRLEGQLFLSGDTVYVTGQDSRGDEYERWIAPINAEAGEIGERIALDARNIVDGMRTEDGSVVIVDDKGVSKVSLSEKTTERLVLWKNVNLDLSGQNNHFSVLLLPEGRVFFQLERMRGNEKEWFFLDKEAENPHGEKKVIRVGGMHLGNEDRLQKAIFLFNENNPDYRAEMTDDYSWETGEVTMYQRFLSDDLPDVLYSESFSKLLPVFASGGAFYDMYDYMGSDPSFKKDDFFENLFATSETDGKLLYMFGAFNLGGFVGGEDWIGKRSGWNFEEFDAFAELVPSDILPFQKMTAEGIVNCFTSASMSSFVDVSSGTVNFESEEFARILLFAEKYGSPENEVYFSDSNPPPRTSVDYVLSSVGGEFGNSLQTYYGAWGRIEGSVSFVGYPSEERAGPACSPFGSFAISASSMYKDGAWEFVKILLGHEIQSGMMLFGLPIRRSALDDSLEQHMNPPADSFLAMTGARPLPQETADILFDTIDSIKRIDSAEDYTILDIIAEEVQPFFTGQKSLEATRAVIQSRVQTYVNEN